VAGACGRLGSVVVNLLRAAGNDVLAVDLEEPNMAVTRLRAQERTGLGAQADQPPAGQVAYRQADLTDLGQVYGGLAGDFEHRVTIYGRRTLPWRVTSEELYRDQQPNDALHMDHATADVAFGGVLQDFARAVEGSAPTVGAMDGLGAVEIIEAATRAARERRLVDLPLAPI